MTKKIKVTWTETVHRQVTADIEVDEDFVIPTPEEYNPIAYYLEHGIYEKIQFGDFDEIDKCELETDAESTDIQLIEEWKEMDRNNIVKRMIELEEKANTKYQSVMSFSFILECLSEEEQQEYEKLRKALNYG